MNGFASVTAAVGVIPLSMIWGFRVALLSGGAAYLAAFALGSLLRRRSDLAAPAAQDAPAAP